MPDFIKLTCDSYAVMLSFVPWLVAFQHHAEDAKDERMMVEFDHFCSGLMTNCLVCLKPEVWMSIR